MVIKIVGLRRRFVTGIVTLEQDQPEGWQGFRGTISDMSASEHTLHIFMGFNALVISVFHFQSCTKVVRDGELGETPIK